MLPMCNNYCALTLKKYCDIWDISSRNVYTVLCNMYSKKILYFDAVELSLHIIIWTQKFAGILIWCNVTFLEGMRWQWDKFFFLCSNLEQPNIYIYIYIISFWLKLSSSQVTVNQWSNLVFSSASLHFRPFLMTKENFASVVSGPCADLRTGNQRA